jgi:hypothetical protein
LLAVGRQGVPARPAGCRISDEPATLLLRKGVTLLTGGAASVLLRKGMSLLPSSSAPLTRKAMTLLTFRHAELLAPTASGLLMASSSPLMGHPCLRSREASTVSAPVGRAASESR